MRYFQGILFIFFWLCTLPLVFGQTLNYKSLVTDLNKELNEKEKIKILATYRQKLMDETNRDSIKLVQKAVHKFYKDANSLTLPQKCATIQIVLILHESLNECEDIIKKGKSFAALLKKEKGYEYELSQINLQCGACYNELGQNALALEQYLEGLSYDSGKIDSTERAMLFINMGVMFSDMGDSKQAYEYNLKVESLLPGIQSSSLKVSMLANIGAYFIENEDYKSAEKYFANALKLYDQNKVKSFEYYNLIENLGIVYSYTERVSEAQEIYQEVLDFGLEFGIPHLQSMAHIDMAYLFSENNQLKKGIYHGKKALEGYSALKDTFAIMTTNKFLYGLYESNGDYKAALTSYKDYEEINHKMNSAANIKKITSMRKDYEFEKERQEIELVTARKEARANQIQYSLLGGLGLAALFSFFLFRTLSKVRKTKMLVETQNTQLEELSASNEQLLFSLSHDIKEPMLGLQMLLDEIKLDDSMLDDAKTSLNTQVKSVNGILRNLLDIKKNQGQTDATVDGPQIYAIIQEVLQSQVQKAESKQLNIDLVQDKIEQLRFDLSPQKFYLLMLNTLNNAIKYSPKHGVIRIDSENGDLSISNTIRQEENLSAQSLQSDGVGLALVKELLNNTKVKLDIIKEVNLFKARLQTTA